MKNVIFKIGVGLLVISAFTLLVQSPVFAGAKDQADKMFQRLNGTPPSLAKLDEMTGLIEKGDYRAAALAAIDDESGNFYNVILRNWWTPFTNENENSRADLNDYSALVIGMVRDEVRFDSIMSADLLYLGVDPSGNPLPPYTQAEDNNEFNRHFRAVQERNLPLHKVLKSFKQSEVTDYSEDVAAGAFSTWGFAKDYYNAGTNRAAIRFALKTMLCHDMEQLHDPTRPDYRVRRDVARDPGGDSTVFRNKCAGCHAGMDGLAGAFSYWDYTDDDGVVYNPTDIPDKINRNGDVFPPGFVTSADEWVLLWHKGPNKKIGWHGEKKGYGVKSLGKMLASTDAFARCMASNAIEMVCQPDMKAANTRSVIEQLAHSFKRESGGVPYNLKHLFASSAVMCKGE